jgi:hypothetical protein
MSNIPDTTYFFIETSTGSNRQPQPGFPVINGDSRIPINQRNVRRRMAERDYFSVLDFGTPVSASSSSSLPSSATIVHRLNDRLFIDISNDDDHVERSSDDDNGLKKSQASIVRFLAICSKL